MLYEHAVHYWILKYNRFQEFNINKTSHEVYTGSEVTENPVQPRPHLLCTDGRSRSPFPGFQGALAQGPGSLSRPWAPSHTWLRSLLPQARVPGGPRRRPRDSQTPGPLRCCSPTRAAAALGTSGKGDGTSPRAPLSAAAARRHPARCPSSPCGAAARGALGKAVSALPESPGRGCLLGASGLHFPGCPARDGGTAGVLRCRPFPAACRETESPGGRSCGAGRERDYNSHRPPPAPPLGP